MHGKKLYGTATVGSKGQIVIPAQAREALGIKTGDKLYVAGLAHNNMVMLLPEAVLEDMIQQMNLDIENLRKIK
jgi:AbrB family looped-hinge helix DNA binding protein